MRSPTDTNSPEFRCASLGATVTGIVVNERLYGTYNDTPFIPPTLVGDPETIADGIRACEGPLEFTLVSAEQTPVRLIPYHRIAHERYATYWKIRPAASF